MKTQRYERTDEPDSQERFVWEDWEGRCKPGAEERELERYILFVFPTGMMHRKKRARPGWV